MFAERLESLVPMHPEWGEMQFQTDFQLQVEHALDLREHGRVLFVDASATSPAPFSVLPLRSAKDASFTTHSMTPQAVMYTYRKLEGRRPPPTWLLAIRGDRFELGEDPSPMAQQHLLAALGWAEDWLAAGPSASTPADGRHASGIGN